MPGYTSTYWAEVHICGKTLAESKECNMVNNSTISTEGPLQKKNKFYNTTPGLANMEGAPKQKLNIFLFLA
jgi:hypothetical protein